MKNLCSECFRNLGVESRLRIFNYLSKKENAKANVTEITQHIGLKQPTVSYHLKEMQESGLLKRITEGKEVYYSINHNCPHDGIKCIVSQDINNATN